MTEAERKLLDVALRYGANTTEVEFAELEAARALVMAERIPPGAKEEWMAASRELILARAAVVAVLERHGLQRHDLSEWRAELQPFAKQHFPSNPD